MRMSIVFAGLVAASWLLFFLVGSYAAAHLTVGGFASRFPERSLAYKPDELKTFATSHRQAAEFYAAPVLFPIDLIVMVLLAGSMAAASYYWLNQLNFPVPWLALVLPAIYLLTDFVEDNLLAGYLLKPDDITPARIDALKWFTWLKLGSVIGASVQTALVFAAFLVSHLPFIQRG